MMRTAAVLVTAVVALTTLAGCGGEDPYCSAVRQHRSALDTFGEKRTDAGFATYEKAVRAITATAPESSRDDWAKLRSVTGGVIKAHQKVGIRLQDMADTAKVADLSAADLKTLNDAYDRFNETTAQRTAVVDDVSAVCSITLK